MNNNVNGAINSITNKNQLMYNEANMMGQQVGLGNN